MPQSRTLKISEPRPVAAPKGRSSFLIVFLSIMLAVYIGLISYWLINADSNSELAVTPSEPFQVSATPAKD